MAEGKRHMRGIRARVTLTTVIVTFIAMAAVVALSAWASWTSMREVIDRSLIERLDDAAAAVAIGDYERATDSSGTELLQVIDRNGNVIASSENAQGLAAIPGSKESDEVDDVQIERNAVEESPASSGSQGGQSSASGYDSSNDADDIDDDDDDDADGEDADDAYDDDSVAADSASNTGNAGYSNSDDDDADEIGEVDDGDDDNDVDDNASGTDDDDDDDKGVPHALAPIKAYAAEPQDASSADSSSAIPSDEESISASDALGSPGPFLVMRRQAQSPDGEVTLVAMTSLAPAVEVARNTAWQIAAILAVLLVLAALFTWHMTGRTLRPVETMRREVEAISPNDLDERITAPDGDPDLAELAVTFNGMLERVQGALTEQKRFVSDASHELKSPIAATGLMLETLQGNPELAQDRQIIDDLMAENDRMNHIVGDLLTLARQDEGRLNVQKRLADYCDILYEETESLRHRHSVTVDDSDVAPIVGMTDPDMLSHAIRNLLDNAACYAETSVFVSCREIDACVEIRIGDDGPGIPPADRERVFGRFVRLESDRARTQGSTGLGLAVTRGIIEQLGGTVAFSDPDHGGATAVIRLPLA